MDARFDVTKLDANESAFFKRQLEFVKSKTFDAKFRPNKAMSIFPVSTEAGAAATEITWRQYTRVGLAKMVADYATDFPLVDIYGEEHTVKPQPIGAGYHYSIEEIRRAQMAGIPLETRRAEAARRAIEDKIDYIAWFGDTNTGLNGFISYPGISEYTVVSGTSGAKTWSTKTADEILRDLNGALSYVSEQTNGVEIPDTVLLPLAQFNLIKTKRLGDGSDETVLSYFRKVNPQIKMVEAIVELGGAGDSNTDRGMVFVNDASHLNIELPLAFEQFDADKEGMQYKIPCYAKTAGMIVYYPASVAYFDGI
jgi:hypothetical protein